jgi:ATP-dependent RNA helicase DDX56/DBP9
MTPSKAAAATILDPHTTIASLDLALDARLEKALHQRLQLRRPTLVQAQTWPVTLQQGRSVLVQAPTGSGKTLAYLVPVVQKILQQPPQQPSRAVQAVVLVPTRELCSQVHTVVQQLCHYCATQVPTAVLSVGRSTAAQASQQVARQQAALRDDPVLIIATPAGLAQSADAMDLSAVHTVVLDEADLLLSLGHESDLRAVVQGLPRIYQGLIVSATLPKAVQELQAWVLDRPVTIQVESDDSLRNSKAAAQLKQLYLPCASKDKYLVLYVFLKLGLLRGKGLFFVASVDAGYRLKLFLQLFHIRAAVLNAELPLASRLHCLEQFHLGNMDYLIATDASTAAAANDADPQGTSNTNSSKRRDTEYGVARGVDFHRVSFVVNVDFPKTPTAYRHRIGRTARGGRSGVALSLVSNDKTSFDEEYLQSVQDDQPCIPLVQAAATTQGLTPAAAATEEDTQAGDAPVEQSQPVLLDFNLLEIEGFRYRVEDVSRAVTRKAVREARSAELKAEILNSERLQQHFDHNPADAKLLQHDRPVAVLQAPEHLKHVPKYLLPKGMQVANLNKKRKKRKKPSTFQRASKDPLQSFEGGGVNLEGVAVVEEGHDEDELDDTTEGMNDAPSKRARTDGEESRVFTNTHDGTGTSTAGRNAWKERHRKGKFSSKKKKSERRSEPLGI